MAVLAKKIYIKNSAGTQQTVTLYSTTSEVSTASGYTYQLVDGVTAYAPLVSTSHAKATSGRVIKGGTTYAWGSTAPAPAYTYKTITTAGSGTFTVPSNVTKLRVTCVGGGAGGCSGFNTPAGKTEASGSCASPHTTLTTAVGGGTTTFGSITAKGGTSVIIGCWTTKSTCTSSEGSYTCYPDYYVFKQLSTGYNNGTLSTSSDVVDGASAVPMVGYNGTTRASVGSGGYADSGNESIYTACTSGLGKYVHSGASGYRTVSTITVTPGQTISYTVGAGGKWHDSSSLQSSTWNSGGHGGNLGVAGGILIEYGSGIE